MARRRAEKVEVITGATTGIGDATAEPFSALGAIVGFGDALPGNTAGEAVEIARGAVYLPSDDGAFVNCHDLIVDGGITSVPNT